MQPEIITLPDELRDAFEAACASHGLNQARSWTRAGAMERSKLLTDITQQIFFPLHPEAHTKVRQQFQEALLGMVTGEGAPALRIDNLPPRYWREVLEGLNEMFKHTENRSVYDERPFYLRRDYRPTQRPHMDGNAAHTIRVLYCNKPGWPKQPTVFITVDEVVKAMACERVGLSIDSSPAEIAASAKRPDYEKAREAILDRLLERAHDTRAERGFLYRNPHYVANDNSPEFLMRANYPTETDFISMAERLHTKWSHTCETSTQPNSIVIWNNDLVLHGKGKARWPLPRTSTRELVDYNMTFHTNDMTQPGGHPIGSRTR